ncbi:SufE family protein [Commensalibacter nepenthis]|uniref:SufE family protein n=1 Tax=Commensalibacter nepenthis TaxID=3043872 RepID=A0ABT6Q614_9PROT|nr:SufE family protein [Commensalibacter sp. TBRC 10068]MDI2112339.1 SufE family protein [Commensalibacter sp. TBRC 10068]
MSDPFIVPEEDSAAEAIEAIRDELELFDDWMQRYRYLIDLGEKLPEFPIEWQTDQFRVVGCQSQVWLNFCEKDGKLFFAGSSDAVIVKGLIALLLRIYSGRDAVEIVRVDPIFITDLGLAGALSANRSNGVASMVKAIQTISQNYL